MGMNSVNLRSCLVKRITDQTALVTATPTAVIFSTAVANKHAMAEFTTNPSRITINKSGLYFVFGKVRWAAGSTGLRTLQVQKNGTASAYLLEVSQAAPASGTGLQQISGLVYLVSGDYIQLIATHSQGANLDLTADTTALTPGFGCALVDPDYDPSAAAEAL